MNLTSPTVIKELLEKYNAKPSKGLGQNFLIDKNILDKIIAAANIKPSDTILEVGPGLGVLTQELAKHAKKVIAIEKDKTMIEILKETLKDFDNVEVIEGDILKIDFTTSSLREYSNTRSNLKVQIASSPDGSLPAGRQARNYETAGYKLVANIPYYLTSPLIRKFLEAENQPSEMVLMMQKEVAQRICAKPPQMSLLAVSVQFYADPKIVSYVSKNSFWPAPKIDSAIIKITPHSDSSLREAERRSNLFFKIVKAGFAQPRKQLVGNLSKNLNLSKEQVNEWLSKNNINPTQRAETLSVENWKNLASSLNTTSPSCG